MLWRIFNSNLQNFGKLTRSLNPLVSSPKFCHSWKKRKEIELWRYRHVLIMSFGPPFVTVYFSYRGVPRLFPFVSLTGAYWREIQYQRPFKKRPLSVNFLTLTKAFLGFFRLWILVEHIEGWYNIGAFKRPLLLLIFLYYQRRSLLGFFRL